MAYFLADVVSRGVVRYVRRSGAVCVALGIPFEFLPSLFLLCLMLNCAVLFIDVVRLYGVFCYNLSFLRLYYSLWLRLDASFKERGYAESSAVRHVFVCELKCLTSEWGILLFVMCCVEGLCFVLWVSRIESVCPLALKLCNY